MANIRIFLLSSFAFPSEHLRARLSIFFLSGVWRVYAQRNAYNFSVESGNNRIAAKQQKFEREGGQQREILCVCVCL